MANGRNEGEARGGGCRDPLRSTKEATALLSLPPAEFARVVQELRQPSWPASTAHEHILEPLGIFQLTMEEASALANRRRDQDP